MLFMEIVRSPYAHARILNIDTSAALKVPGVVAVVTGKDLEAAGLHWMPTLMSDTQMVLPTDRVVYQSQEVACVLAEDRYTAADGAAAVEVEYEPLEPVIDPHKALVPDSPLVRPDKEKKSNHIWHWEAGDGTPRSRRSTRADVVVSEDIYIPRIHVASIETCGCVASFDRVSGKLTVWMTTQAPHAIRTVFSLVSKIPEHKIRVISPDIGGGFGGKVPVYPGYVCAVVAALTTGRPVKWIEDRSENLQADSFARDYHIHAELAADETARCRRCASRPSPTTAPPTPPPTRPSSRPACSRSAPARTTCPTPSSRSTASTPTSRPAASPTAARSASPRRCT